MNEIRLKNFDLKVHVSNYILGNMNENPLLLSELTYLLNCINFIELVRTYYDEDNPDSVITTINEIESRVMRLPRVTYRVGVSLITNHRSVEVLLYKKNY